MGKSRSTHLRLLLVDDHAVMRVGLANMLTARPEFEVVGEADDGNSALKIHEKLSPDVTVLDVVMPGIGGLECLRRLKQKSPSAKVLMLSSSELAADIHEAIALGANGYVMKSSNPTELIASILAVGNGEDVFDEDILGRLTSYADSSQLTPREIEVLHLLRKGMSNPDIGLNLGITARTAKAHVAAILQKLDANDRAEAVAKGFERGLLRV